MKIVDIKDIKVRKANTPKVRPVQPHQDKRRPNRAKQKSDMRRESE